MRCYARGAEIKSNLLQRSTANDVGQRISILAKALEYIISYIGIVIMLPDMFSQAANFIGTAPSEVISEVIHNRLTSEFVLDLINRHMNDDGVEQVRWLRSRDGQAITEEESME
jgi:hypothetical protein